MESDASCRKVSSCFLYDEAYLSQPGIIFVIGEIQAGQNIVDKEHACDALYPCAKQYYMEYYMCQTCLYRRRNFHQQFSVDFGSF